MGGQRERVRGQSRELLYSIPTALCEEIASAATAELADRLSIPKKTRKIRLSAMISDDRFFILRRGAHRAGGGKIRLSAMIRLGP